VTQTKILTAAIFGLLLMFSTGAYAQTAVSATDVPTTANDKSARVTVLDKQTNRLQTLIMVAGQAQTVGSLDVKLTKCLPDYAGQLGQDVAWLDVSENDTGNASGTDWFSGWMFNTYPEVSTLDHPRYDVILQGCGTKARKIIQTIGSAPVLDAAPAVDTETVADPATGGDPYAVPGVADASAPKPEEAAPAEQPADTETAPVEQPAEQPAAAPAAAAPIAQPVQPTPPAPQQPAASPEQKQDLHNLMDGTY
jgi:hypothetical protein